MHGNKRKALLLWKQRKGDILSPKPISSNFLEKFDILENIIKFKFRHKSDFLLEV